MAGNEAFRDLYGRVASRRASRRRFLAGTAAAAGAAALAGPRVIVPARAQEKTKVVFWTAFTPPALDHLKQITMDFNAQSTDVEAELVQLPPGEETDVTQLITAVRGGTGPDIYHLDRFIVAQYAAAGALQDLGEISGGEDVLAPYLEFARNEATYDGKAYALPTDTDTRALYYNKTMLQSVGVDPAEFDPANGPVTLDRVAEIAAQLNVKDSAGNYTQVGFVPWFNQGWHYTYGFAFGGDFYDEEACQVTPTDPNIVAAFQWAQDYCVAQGAQELFAFAGPGDEPGFPSQENYFTVGTLAMQVTGDWHIRQMEQYNPDLDYGITYIPVPTAEAEPSTWAGGWSVVIPQGAKQPEAALTFMQYLAGEPGQRTYLDLQSALPTIQSLAEDPSLYGERHKFFAEMLATIAKNRPPLPVGAKYWDELSRAWQATYLNEAQPEEALQEAQENTQSDLDRFC
jgi:multiple sugar transport system substrate-binding protein